MANITPVSELEKWMKARENEQLEFKEAKNNFHFETLVKYVVALANEGGGKLILGVADKHPRHVVGSAMFTNLERTKAGLVERLHIRIDAEKVAHPNGRVVIFHVPARPIGMPIHYKGAYWMRAGEDLVPMTPDQLKRIFDEGVPDFSATICINATVKDLNPKALAAFRRLWQLKSGNTALDSMSDQQLLHDAELLYDDDLTYAALILFGTRQALGRFLAQAEVIYEYRSSEASVEHQIRKEFREGFFAIHDTLWEVVNNRNDVQHIQQGLFMQDLPTFNEKVVREAIMNAISHRDYRLSGSTFICQYPRKLKVTSPGGFPPGITEENILYRQAPRNRRIAEALTKAGLIERSGQGIDKMFIESIREGKAHPEFTGTDDYQVVLTLHGDIQNPHFVQLIEEIGQEQQQSFSLDDFQVLDLAYKSEAIPENLKSRIPNLVEQGLLEQIGRGKGTRYILSKRFYKYLGKKGTYTRKKGLDRQTNKELLLKHIVDNAREGSKLADLKEVLPQLTEPQIQSLLRDLKKEGRIHVKGATKAARWFPKSKS